MSVKFPAHFNISLSILILMCSSLLLKAQKRGRIYDDEVFDPLVKSVLLYPETRRVNQTTHAPIISLNQRFPLRLEFDILEEEYRVLQAKIIHCNADWTKSVLNDIEYVEGYNGFDIQEFDYSSMGKTLYVNYWIYVPRVRVSGNYILMVYQDNNPKDVLLTRRFVIFEDNLSINPLVRVSTSVSSRRANQQIDFSFVHSKIPVRNPKTEFKVVIRQNNRWDNAITDLKPTRVNPTANTVEYAHFGGENNFMAGNEFRFVDLRTYTFRGRYVSAIDRNKTPIAVVANLEKNRAKEVYSELSDMNGAFIISTMEAGASYLDADYLSVKFRLKTEPTLDSIYLIGSFNCWKKNENSQMKYDPKTGTYFNNAVLKQGIYDYQFHVDSVDPLRFEGSFYQTNNQYDIIVYYKSFSDLTDRVVGYRSFLAEL